MIALWMTPDEIVTPADALNNIYPEPAIPAAGGVFPNNDALPTPGDKTKDGWRRVNFYLMADVQSQTYNAIRGVQINVYYPQDDGGALKFEIDAQGTPGGSWTASQSGYAAETYPGGIAATIPTWSVRELHYADFVDVNADGYVVNDSDQTVGPFLTAWGSRVVYGTDPANGNVPWTALTAGQRLQSGESLLLELQGWIWFHQDPVTYTVKGTATAGDQSPALTNYFNFVPTVNLYLDFDTIAYSTVANPVTPGVKAIVQGDTNLATPGSPTIWDNGNIDAMVTVNATKMVLNGDPTFYNNSAKTISRFDAALYYKSEDGTNLQVGYVEYDAGTPTLIVSHNPGATTPVYEMGPTGPVLLQACRPAKIDFSVLPATGLVPGTYRGTMTISIEAYETPAHG
jgi:hypothetical protein